MHITQEMINKKFDTLPADIQQVISSDAVLENMKSIGQKYDLRVDKTGEMIDEIGMVMLGFHKSADFMNNLSRRLEIDKERAEAIAVDIDREVFTKIRESLRGVQFDEQDSTTPADEDYGESPARDSLLKEVEKHGSEETFTSSDDYSVESFIDEGPAPTPYQEHVVSDSERMDPSKTFRDHLQKKVEAAAPKINNDPYRESIE